jgi:hypothetical protein
VDYNKGRQNMIEERPRGKKGKVETDLEKNGGALSSIFSPSITRRAKTLTKQCRLAR